MKVILALLKQCDLSTELGSIPQATGFVSLP
jgi:hypothetical protein